MGAGLEDGFFFFFNKKEAQEGFGGVWQLLLLI